MSVWCVVGGAVLLGICHLGLAQVYVASDGDDGATGSRDRPVQTLSAAQRLARAMRADAPSRRITITLAPGTYPLDETLELGKADGGGTDGTTVWQAAEPGTARISGGLTIPAKAFEPVTSPSERQRLPRRARNEVLRADLRALGLADYGDPVELGRAPELFLDGEPMTLARWPNAGWARIADVPGEKFKTHGVEGSKVGRIGYSGDRPTRWVDEREHLRLQGYWFWDWADEFQRVRAIDTDAKVIMLAEPWHHYGYRKGQRYFAQNVLGELDAAGEWFIDREAGVLYFYPPEALEGRQVVLSVLTKPLVRIKDADRVRIEGLVFEHVRGRAVEVTGCREVELRRCVVRSTGTDGVVIDGGARCEVRETELHNIGSAAVRLSGGDRRTLEPCGHDAVDNHIHHFGRNKRTYAGAVHLSGVGCRMTGNRIHDGPHLAVLFSGNDHVMERNRIHHVCQETGDVGVFYTGRDWTARGHVIRENLIHDVHGPGMWHAQVIYLDDAASGIEVRSNIIYRCQRAMHIGGGRDNVIVNNLIVDCEMSINVDARGLGWMKYHVEPDGIMQQRLKALPYQRGVWARRYPALVNILEDDPGAPKGNIIRHNLVVYSGPIKIAEPAVEHGTVEHNVETDDAVSTGDPMKGTLKVDQDAAPFDETRGWQPIPLDSIPDR